MNLAMISFRLPFSGVKRGGGERVAHDLADGLARRGHRVTVWSADPKPAGAAYEVAPLPARRFIHHWLGFRLTSGYIGNILVLLPRYGDADALLAHGDSLLLPLRGIPVLRVMHGSALDEARTARTLARKLLQYGVYAQEWMTAATQVTVGVSRNTQARYPAIRGVIPNGVDTGRFHPGAFKSPEPSILFVGTLGGRKRGLLLHRWFCEVIRPAIPHATLWMVTEDGPAAPGVQYFRGATEIQLAELYRTAWVFASPSVYEGFGLPYLEAMASGTAVVAMENPGSREVLADGDAGQLIQSDEDFAPAVLALLADPVRRARWEAQGLRRSAELSVERMVESYEAVLETLVRTPASREACA